MPEKKSVVEKQDLSRFGKKDLHVGDKVVINAGKDREIVGLPNGVTVKVTEVRHGGAQFRVEKIMKGDEKPDRDYLIWANQID